MTLPKYDYHYFERGIENGISLYENYRWLPEVSLPIANYIKEKYKFSGRGGDLPRVLDFGCAKGFLVHALRLLNIKAYGYDISDYALENCHEKVKNNLFRSKEAVPDVDVIFVKDVLEHMDYKIIDEELKWICWKAYKVMVIVPLGENNKYRIPEYIFDKTHVIKENEDWWFDTFKKAGFIVDEFYYKIDGIKKNWENHNPFGNGFFIMRRI